MAVGSSSGAACGGGLHSGYPWWVYGSSPAVCFLFLLILSRNQTKPIIAARPMTPTPTPIPMLAPLLRPPLPPSPFDDDVDDCSLELVEEEEEEVLDVDVGSKSPDRNFTTMPFALSQPPEISITSADALGSPMVVFVRVSVTTTPFENHCDSHRTELMNGAKSLERSGGWVVKLCSLSQHQSQQNGHNEIETIDWPRESRITHVGQHTCSVSFMSAIVTVLLLAAEYPLGQSPGE